MKTFTFYVVVNDAGEFLCSYYEDDGYVWHWHDNPELFKQEDLSYANELVADFGGKVKEVTVTVKD